MINLDATKCSVCSTDYNEVINSRRPTALTPCVHSFCETCVNTVITTAEQEEREATCPVCRSIFLESVPNYGMIDLLRLVQEVKRELECAKEKRRVAFLEGFDQAVGLGLSQQWKEARPLLESLRSKPEAQPAEIDQIQFYLGLALGDSDLDKDRLVAIPLLEGIQKSNYLTDAQKIQTKLKLVNYQIKSGLNTSTELLLKQLKESGDLSAQQQIEVDLYEAMHCSYEKQDPPAFATLENCQDHLDLNEECRTLAKIYALASPFNPKPLSARKVLLENLQRKQIFKPFCEAYANYALAFAVTQLEALDQAIPLWRSVANDEHLSLRHRSIARFYLGCQLPKDGPFLKEAVEHLLSVVDNPLLPSRERLLACYHLGICLYLQQNFYKAIGYLEWIVPHQHHLNEKEQVLFKQYLALSLHAHREFDRALPLLEAILNSPYVEDPILVQIYLARAQLHAGKYSDAMPLLRTVQGNGFLLPAHHIPLSLTLGIGLTVLKDYAAAIPFLQKVSDSDDLPIDTYEKTEAQLCLALCSYKIHQAVDSFSFLRNVPDLAISPNLPLLPEQKLLLQLCRGIALWHKDRQSAGKVLLSELALLSPDDFSRKEKAHLTLYYSFFLSAHPKHGGIFNGVPEEIKTAIPLLTVMQTDDALTDPQREEAKLRLGLSLWAISQIKTTLISERDSGLKWLERARAILTSFQHHPELPPEARADLFRGSKRQREEASLPEEGSH